MLDILCGGRIMGCRNRDLSEHRTTALKQWNRYLFLEGGRGTFTQLFQQTQEVSSLPLFFTWFGRQTPHPRDIFKFKKKLLVFVFETLQVLTLSSKCEFLNYLQKNELYQHLNKKGALGGAPFKVITAHHGVEKSAHDG